MMDFDCCIPQPPDFPFEPPPDPSAWLAIPPLDCEATNSGLPFIDPFSDPSTRGDARTPAWGVTGPPIWESPTFALAIAAVVIFCLTVCTAVTVILYCRKRALKPASSTLSYPTPPKSSPVSSGQATHWIFNTLVLDNPKGLSHTQSVLEVAGPQRPTQLHRDLHSASFTADHLGSHPILRRYKTPTPPQFDPVSVSQEYHSIRVNGPLPHPIYEEIHSLDRSMPNYTRTCDTNDSRTFDNTYTLYSKPVCCDDSSCSDISLLPEEAICCQKQPCSQTWHHSPCETSGGRESGYSTQGLRNLSADGSYDSPPLHPAALSRVMGYASAPRSNGVYGVCPVTTPGSIPRMRNGPSAIKTNPLIVYNRSSRNFGPSGDFV